MQLRLNCSPGVGSPLMDMEVVKSSGETIDMRGGGGGGGGGEI